ncbi:MAG: hypothetical protein M3033_17725 [Acidobacteriota bacterium]|nr:hypothetical protein [Acidobacteriota bacterium]
MRKQNILLITICVLAITFAFSACQKSVAGNSVVSSEISPNQVSSKTPSPRLNSPIRKIDFRNFTYPWTEGLSTKDEKNFTLKDGEIPFERDGQMGVSLEKIEYVDITGDGADEAILIISLQTGGSAVPNVVYVYTIEKEKPKLLWSFYTGDRAEGGLKKVYAENGNLIVELFSNNKFIESKNEFEFPSELELKNGLCCPTNFTQFRFKWNGEKFVVKGKPELFEYDMKK